MLSVLQNESDFAIGTRAVVVVGVVSAVTLVPLLVATLTVRGFRIWPTPGPGSRQSIVFWSLFRTLNVTAIVLAITTIDSFLGLPQMLRFVAGAGLAFLAALYAYALLALGKSNTYCAQVGLVTAGIYRWTRNPQYATIMPLYVCLALAADSAVVYGLCGALIAVYVLMALVEEPWLEAAYGEQYRRYKVRVPRFYNPRRAETLVRALLRRLQRQIRRRLSPLRARLSHSAAPDRGADALPSGSARKR